MDVLVLSSTREPINQVTWRRAFTLLALGVVEVHEEYTDWNVCTSRQVFKVPAVIQFIHGATAWRKGVRFSRENVYARDKGKCQYCQAKVTKSEFTYDHVIPRAQGGRTRWENIVIACLACNQRKGNRTPAEARMHLRVTPERPKSLPGTQRLALPSQIPVLWRPYLRDFGYWHGELETD